jgi:hypothetical protein
MPILVFNENLLVSDIPTWYLYPPVVSLSSQPETLVAT